MNNNCNKYYATLISLRTFGFFLVLSMLSLQFVSAQPQQPPLPVPLNASRVTATVLEYSVWPPGSLSDAKPPILSDETVYSVKVKIHTSEQVRSDLEYFAVPGTTYEAFSSDVLVSDLVDKEIEASLELTGTTQDVRWWISNICVGGPSNE